MSWLDEKICKGSYNWKRKKRIVDGDSTEEDLVVDYNARPKYLSDYVGQQSVREQLDIFLSAAKKRNEALDHTLIFGPPGLGKLH